MKPLYYIDGMSNIDKAKYGGTDNEVEIEMKNKMKK